MLPAALRMKDKLDMNMNDAIEQLRPFNPHIPTDALAVLREHWVAAEPLLLEELDRRIKNPLDEEESALFLYALYLCAEMRCEAAFERYVKLCRMPRLLQDHLLGDVLCESMDELLLRSCAGRFDALKQLVVDETANEYARSAALEALQKLALDGVFSKEEASAFCIELLEDKLEQRESFIWNQCVSMAAALQLKKALPLIEFAYDAGWVDSFFQTLDDVKSGLKRECPAPREPFSSTEDQMHAFTRNWNGATEESGVSPESDLLNEPRRVWRRRRVAQGKEPGRNDSCPCGSGKKYKKCCIGVGWAMGEDAEAGGGFIPKNAADEWIAAGYFHKSEGSIQDVLRCWDKGWEEALRILPESIRDPDEDACDLLFDSCESFSDWVQDYLMYFEEHVSWGVHVFGKQKKFMDEALERFPGMEADFWADFEKARIRLFLQIGSVDKAFELLNLLKEESESPVVWLEFESNLVGWDAPKYNLPSNWKRALQLMVEAQKEESCSESKKLMDEPIDCFKNMLREDEAVRRKRMTLMKRTTEVQGELFG